MAKPDYYRSGNTISAAKTNCSDAQCEKNCIFPECCCDKTVYPSEAAADSAEHSLTLLKNKVQRL